VTILRERHPFEGRALPVMGTIKRRGILLLLVVLPDGSRSLIPANWTDWEAVGLTDVLSTHGRRSPCFARLADLLHARAIVDALLGRCPPCKELSPASLCRFQAISSRHIPNTAATHTHEWLHEFLGS
jgi:hypothetical protein